MKRLLIVALVMLGLYGATIAWGADWPQYRCDAGRSASSPEQLPATLHLQWVRHLPAPRPAFRGEVRLRFDASYEPVVLGRTMFVPSMVADTVTALDIETGSVRWQFFAEGPVRFAPVAWEGSVYFVSDDGYLYCVDAAEGKLRWKFRGVARGSEAKDRKLLGSGRLISLFPARGGPVLQDGVVYFAAGLWSAYGAAVHAVDARSGQVVWSNAESNHVAKANMDHGVAHEAGLSPQGYLTIVQGMLVVPCGAQLPAFLDLKTGDLKTYTMGWGGRNGLPKGTWFVAGARNFLSHGGDLYDVTRPNDERFDNPRGPDFKSMLYPGGWTRVQIDPTNQKDLGAFGEPVFGADVMYDGDRGVTALDLAEVRLEERKQSPIPPERRDDTYPDRWKMSRRELWRFDTKLRVHVKAGGHLYLGGPGAVEAVRLPQPGQQAESAWRGTIEGTPQRMLAAGGRLFVVTREGAIHAFGAQQRDRPPVHGIGTPKAKATSPSPGPGLAGAILQATQVREGYALVLGAGTGRLLEDLIEQSSLQLIVVEPSADAAAAMRSKLHALGLYGTRVSICTGDWQTISLPPLVASLVVSEDWGQVRRSAGPRFLASIFRVLRPYGGTACLGLPAAEREALAKELAEARLPGATSRASGDWLLVTRAGPLAGSADWSHAEADAANTGASEEQFLKAPLELLWFDTPPRWFRTPGTTLVRVCAGRMFLKAQKLDAVDAFTGLPLWETSLPLGSSPNDQFVATEGALYVTGGRNCVVLDPATGRKTGQIDLPADLSGSWANLRVSGDHLVAQVGKHVLCVSRSNGKELWRYPCGRAGLSLAVGGGKVFCAELPVKGLSAKRPGEAAEEDLKTRALDLASGKLVWEIPGGSEVRYARSLDRVVLWSGIHRAGDGGLVAEFPQPKPAPSGKKISPESIPRPLFVVGSQVLVGTVESFVPYDLETGKPAGKATRWTRRGCTIPRASSNFVTTRVLGNAACIDLASRRITSFWNVRAACSNNLFPACGLLNMPSLTGGCTCNYMPVAQAYVPASVFGR